MRFTVDPSGVSEKSREKNPRELVIELARKKAADVAKRHPGRLVLGADTIVVCAGEILGKPKDARDGERMLRLLCGRWQQVWTGVAVAAGGKLYSGAALSKVKARKLPEEKLRALIGKHMDKAGAYAVQDRKDPLVEKVVGDRDNVTGLPMRLVRKLLARAAADRSARYLLYLYVNGTTFDTKRFGRSLPSALKGEVRPWFRMDGDIKRVAGWYWKSPEQRLAHTSLADAIEQLLKLYSPALMRARSMGGDRIYVQIFGPKAPMPRLAKPARALLRCTGAKLDFDHPQL